MADTDASSVVADVLDSVHAAMVGHTGGHHERAAALRELILERLPLASASEVESLTVAVLDRIVGLGALEPLLADPAITDILVNGPGPVWVERGGTLSPTAIRLDADEIVHLVQRVVGPHGLRADRREPTVDAPLPGGGRFHAVLPPLAVGGPHVSIRRPATDLIPLGAFCAPALVELLTDLVVNRRCNVLVSGATGAGKTTLVDALAQLVGPTERLVVIEESPELRLPGQHVARLATRRAGVEGTGAADLSSLVTESLRMRPDRLILGEVRGSEAFALVQALSTGHDGSLATIHASDPCDALRRLEALALAGGSGLPHASLRSSVGSAIDVVAHVARTPHGRRLTTVTEVDRTGDPNLVRPLFADDTVASPPRRGRSR